MTYFPSSPRKLRTKAHTTEAVWRSAILRTGWQVAIMGAIALPLAAGLVALHRRSTTNTQVTVIFEGAQKIETDKVAEFLRTPIKTGTAAVAPTRCDELASADYDPLRRGKEVYYEDMNGLEALEACHDATLKHPEEARFIFLLGRASDKVGATLNAFALLTKAQAAGYVAADLPIARHYLQGVVVPKDPVKARQLVEKAVAAGNASALLELARYNRLGIGGSKDPAKSLDYVQKAAASGLPSGLNDLGWHHRDGIGMTANYATAMELFQKAAALGDLWAMRNIGDLYQRGKGVERNCETARAWYLKAAVSNRTDAKAKIADLLSKC